jgi:hypothetical protein
LRSYAQISLAVHSCGHCSLYCLYQVIATCCNVYIGELKLTVLFKSGTCNPQHHLQQGVIDTSIAYFRELQKVKKKLSPRIVTLVVIPGFHIQQSRGSSNAYVQESLFF